MHRYEQAGHDVGGDRNRTVTAAIEWQCRRVMAGKLELPRLNRRVDREKPADIACRVLHSAYVRQLGETLECSRCEIDAAARRHVVDDHPIGQRGRRQRCRPSSPSQPEDRLRTDDRSAGQRGAGADHDPIGSASRSLVGVAVRTIQNERSPGRRHMICNFPILNQALVDRRKCQSKAVATGHFIAGKANYGAFTRMVRFRRAHVASERDQRS